MHPRYAKPHSAVQGKHKPGDERLASGTRGVQEVPSSFDEIDWAARDRRLRRIGRVIWFLVAICFVLTALFWLVVLGPLP